jgi:hypothetical protein
MDKRITIEQNKADSIDCLAAQRFLYSSAKNYSGLQFYLNVVLIVVGSFVVYMLNQGWLCVKIDLSAYLALASILVTVLNSLLLIPVIKRKKELAAKIQERFDTKVLSLDWNAINIGLIPGSEYIKIFSTKQKNKKNGDQGLKDWYSSIVDSVPIHVGRFICQRSNLSWDVYLREKYLKLIIISSGIIALLVLLIGVQYELNIKDIVLNIASPLLPIVTFCIDQYRDNKESIENLKKLKDDLNSGWQGLISTNQVPEEAYVISRRIQDEIYKNRKDNQLIYDFLYKKYRNEQEEAMYYSVDDMINEYNHILNP